MPADSVDQRTAHVAAQAEQWAKNLIDLGPHNTLLHFVNTKSKSLDLTECEPDRLDELFTGSATSLRALFSDPELFREARNRARGIHRAMRALREEQGLEAGKLACGLVRTQPPSAIGSTASQALRAPLLLRSLSVRPKAANAADFELHVDETGEMNRVLLFALAHQYGMRVDVEAFSDTVDELLAEIDDRTEQIDRAYQEVRRIAEEQQVELELEPSLVLGLFKYEKLPMANDLRAASTLLAEHDIVAAMAGAPDAREKLREAAAEYVQPASDAIEPGDEFLVQDADSSQQRVIQAALDGQHAIIEGPPGTGKSQSIANIIAGAAARGNSVLFVAEKRAAIEAVNERLESVGLGKLVLDMHRATGMKRHVAAQLADSLDTATREPRPEVAELHRRLADRRIRLRNHAEELHEPRAPWNTSTAAALR